MHSPDKTQLFFDLRSRGNCLSYISRTIGVPTSTLSDWNRRYAIDIDASRACKWEAAEQAVKFNTEADLVRVIQRVDAFERELDRRSPERMSVGELVRVISLWRREYFRRRNALLRSIERPSRSCSKHPDESGRISISSDLQPRDTNHSQQPPSESSGSTFDIRRGASRVSDDFRTPKNDRLLSPLPWGEGQGEGQTSPLPSAVPTSAVTAHDPGPAATDKPEPESKSEKTGIPESHSLPFSPAHPHAPHLFSIEDHLPTPMDEWLPDDDDKLHVYRPRQPVDADNPILQKTNIASTA